LNFIFYPEAYQEDVYDELVWKHRLRAERHHITLNKSLVVFYTVPHLFRLHRTTEEALEVEGRFFSTNAARSHLLAGRSRTNLDNDLYRLMRDSSCATMLRGGDMDLALRLITFDILLAANLAWCNFMHGVRSESSWQTQDFETSTGQSPMLADREYIVDFARACRDLVHAIEAAEEAVELAHSFSPSSLSQWRYLKLESKVQRRTLTQMIKDTADNVDSFVANATTLTQEAQAASLKRLTLVASVFLPLTMACSLLSMNSRANEIGPIWWDWLGIVLIIGVVVIVGLRFSAYSLSAERDPVYQRFRRNFKQELARAKDVVREKQLERPPSMRQSHIVPLTPRLLLRASKYVLLFGALVSFLLGMFVQHNSVVVGARALGISVAVALALPVIGILLWRALRPLWNLVRSRYHSVSPQHWDDPRSRSIDPKSTAADGEAQDSSLRRDAQLPTIQGRSRMVPFLKSVWNSKAMWLFRPVLRLCWLIFERLMLLMYKVYCFFFGSLLFDVAIYKAARMVVMNVPPVLIEHFWQLFQKAELIGVKKNRDEETQSEGAEDISQGRPPPADDEMVVMTPLGPVDLKDKGNSVRAQMFDGAGGGSSRRGQPSLISRATRAQTAHFQTGIPEHPPGQAVSLSHHSSRRSGVRKDD
jgi:hypothetical protein